MRKAVRTIVVKDDQLLVMHRNKFGHEYLSLVGGGIDFGENATQALEREIKEETGLVTANPRLVIVEDAGDMFGVQYIYLCDYVSGEPALAADSAEAQIHALGKNLFTPTWVAIASLPASNLLPVELKDLLIKHLAAGFPEAPIELTIQA